MFKKLNNFIYNIIAPYDLYIQHWEFMEKVYDDKKNHTFTPEYMI